MQTAFFLVRRHPNVYLDISGIPPKTLLKYFPRLEEIAHKTLFGTDWPYAALPESGDPAPDLNVLGPEGRSAVEFANAAALVPRLVQALTETAGA